MNNLAMRREAAGKRQEDVAQAMGIDRSTIAKWETGAAMPRSDKLPVLAQLYGCTIDDLFRGEKGGGKDV